MSENNKKPLVSRERSEEWNSLPKKMKVRELKGAEAFYQVMEQFFRTDSDFVRKEKIILDRAGKGLFGKYPPEQWAARTKSLYLSLTAERN